MSGPAKSRCRHVVPHFLAGALFLLYYTVCMSTGLSRAEATMPLTITSTAFIDGGEVPTRYTCEGEDTSPPLDWRGVPDTALSLVLIVDDPDAPDPRAPRMTWVHWVLFNLPPDMKGLPEDVSTGDLPPGTGQGLNSWNRTGYGGPCPPVGRHRYFHKLYALDTVLDVSGKPTSKALEAAMQGHVIGQTELIGTYRKSR